MSKGKVFWDAKNFMDNKPVDFVAVMATNLDPDKLTKDDVKKHGAIYVSLRIIKNDSVIYNKKFNNGQAKKVFEQWLIRQEWVKMYIGPYLEPNTTITVEACGIQSQPFNKLADQNKYTCIPHGMIHFEFNNGWKELDFDLMDKFCQKSIIEGFVVLDMKSGERLKLKHEYFPGDNTGEKRGNHRRAPKMEFGEYTDTGLKLCGGDGLAYDNAAIRCLIEGSTEPNIIAEIIIDNNNNSKLVAKVRPINECIRMQHQFPWDGEKMLNFFETQGQGKFYRYTKQLKNQTIFQNPLDFQLKFDGETALVHKDKNGEVHLMVKIQVDVYEISNQNGTSYRFGWF